MLILIWIFINISINQTFGQSIANLTKTIEVIKYRCGQVKRKCILNEKLLIKFKQICNTSIEGVEGKYFKHIEKEVQCDFMLKETIFDWVEKGLKAPRHFNELPDSIRQEFSHHVS